MPQYDFQALDDPTVTHTIVRPISRAPKDVITVKGRKFKRIYNVQAMRSFKPYKSHVPPKNHPAFAQHTETGHCVVSSRAEEKAYAKEQGLEWN